METIRSYYSIIDAHRQAIDLKKGSAPGKLAMNHQKLALSLAKGVNDKGSRMLF
jgi:hypothetical protein